jgi:hypothetical protein
MLSTRQALPQRRRLWRTSSAAPRTSSPPRSVRSLQICLLCSLNPIACISQGGQLKDGGGAGEGALKKAFSNGAKKNTGKEDQTPLPPELEGYDRELVEKIIADIIDKGHPVSFSDISGLEFAKKCVTELICW